MGLRERLEAIKGIIDTASNPGPHADPERAGRLYKDLANVSMDVDGHTSSRGASTIDAANEGEAVLEDTFPELGMGNVFRSPKQLEAPSGTPEHPTLDERREAYNQQLIDAHFDEQEKGEE